MARKTYGESAYPGGRAGEKSAKALSSVDSVSAGKRLVEEVETFQDR